MFRERSLEPNYPDKVEVYVEDYYRDRDKLELLEKFVDRINDIVLAYETEETMQDIIADLKYELGNVEDEL